MIFSPTILKDRRYLVTGATGGAGRATAKLIADCGGIVTCMGRDPERTEKVKRELSGGGHDVGICDFSFGELKVSQRYDGIFHAAGTELLLPAGASNDEAWDKLFRPSVGAASMLCQAIGKRDSILKDGGSFVVMSSVAAVCGSSGMTVYAASKGAVEALVRSAAIEWAPRRIRVNAIRAGGFQSPMHSRIAARATEGSMADYAARHPLGFGKAEDIANMAVYLLSDAGKWISGTAVTVDGAYSCR